MDKEFSWQNFFTTEEIIPWQEDEPDDQSAANLAEKLNQKLWHHIQTAEKVYGDVENGEYHGQPVYWRADTVECDTHEARIVDVRKL